VGRGEAGRKQEGCTYIEGPSPFANILDSALHIANCKKHFTKYFDYFRETLQRHHAVVFVSVGTGSLYH